MPASSPERSIIILLVGVLAVISAVIGTIWLHRNQQDGIAWVNHTLRVENRLSDLSFWEQAAESSQRGYLLTGRDDMLSDFNLFRSQWRTELSSLRADVRDNPDQVVAVDTLTGMIGRHLTQLQDGIARRDMNAPAGTLPMTGAIRGQIATMKAREQDLLRVRSDNAARLSLLVIAGMALSGALIIVLGMLALRNARRRIVDATRSREALSLANSQLIAEAQEREAAQAQLRQMHKMDSIGQLTGGIAHDFNNMLAIVIGSLDMARRRLGTGADPRVTTAIDNASEGAQRAAQLTARLLAFSRQQPLAPRPTDLNRLVGGMSELLRRTIGEHVRVETVLAGGLWRASVDPNQLENAIINLCVNARDAMVDGGRMTIETGNTYLDDAYAATRAEVEAGQYVAVSVTDTGMGMTPDVVERAFEPFYTTKGVGKGTGLGLSQVFGFVKQSRGHVQIYSEPGEGTTVKLYLPRHYGPDLAIDSAALSTTTLPRAQDGEFVLVVEDEDRVRQMSVESLRELGYQVAAAPNGERALEVLADLPRVDLLFTDIVMPGINGRVLADRAVQQRPGLRLLFTTGYTRNAIVHNGMLDPGVAFLAKPFTFDQLAIKVRQAIDTCADAEQSGAIDPA